MYRIAGNVELTSTTFQTKGKERRRKKHNKSMILEASIKNCRQGGDQQIWLLKKTTKCLKPHLQHFCLKEIRRPTIWLLVLRNRPLGRIHLNRRLLCGISTLTAVAHQIPTTSYCVVTDILFCLVWMNSWSFYLVKVEILSVSCLVLNFYITNILCNLDVAFISSHHKWGSKSMNAQSSCTLVPKTYNLSFCGI